jgi:hypothetical protein
LHTDRFVRIALATCAALPEGWEDERALAAELKRLEVGVELAAWDDPGVNWGRYDRVILRTTWNYARRREDFLAWADSIGERLSNPPPLIRWNSNKRYLADLSADGVPTVETGFVAPGDPLPELRGEVVVKPAVSAGGRDTGRFSPPVHGDAMELIRRIVAEGRTAMVQPYLADVDVEGETAIVFLGGRSSHVLRKRAVLRPDEVAPVRDDGEIGAAKVMYDDDLVGPGDANARESKLAEAVIAQLTDRFGEPPLYARVDMLSAAGGEPVVLELEGVEPNLYLANASGALERFAALIAA